MTFRPELLGGCSIVRELHVYGSVVPVSGRDDKKFQHQGLGALLMTWAEEIAKKEHESVKIAVISGVGTRNYYRKLGYELEGAYMVKSLKNEEYIKALECIEGPKLSFEGEGGGLIKRGEGAYDEYDDDLWLDNYVNTMSDKTKIWKEWPNN